MELERLSLTHFRCFTGASFSFSSGIHLFYGQNGVGKSSILEAISLFITGHSFRTRKASHLIQEGFSKSHLTLQFKERSVPHLLEWDYDGRGSFFFGRKRLKSGGAVVGLLPAVSLTPNDLSLIMGSPDDRRRFLDLILSQRDPLYLHHRLRYEKGLERRNENLKKRRVQSLDAIEVEMERSGTYVIEARLQGIQDLAPLASPLFRHLLGERKSLELIYSTRKTPLSELWKKEREKELALGYTLFGPHRDDVQFLSNGKEIRLFGSEGEKKAYLLALKLAHHGLLKAATGDTPLLLLDDLTASLDKERIERFWGVAQEMGQILITSTAKDPLDGKKGVTLTEVEHSPIAQLE